MPNDDLPPLPEPKALGMDFDRGWDGVRAYGYTADQMRAYARAALAAERERCARVCELRARFEPENSALTLREVAEKIRESVQDWQQ